MTTACELGDEADVRPRLRVAVPSLTIPRLSSPSPQKEKQKLPSSGRGGLGNIRATKSQQFETGSSALLSSLSPSPLFSPKAASEPGSSGASAYSVFTGLNKRTSSNTLRSRLSSDRSTFLDAASISDYDYHQEEIRSELSSPSSPSFGGRIRESVFSSNSVNTFGIAHVPTSPVSLGSKSMTQQRQSDTSFEYARNLSMDMAMRADEKRLRAIKRELGGQGSAGKTAHVQKLRTGRGGAGIYTNVNNDVDAGLFPTTAALTREHELRLAARERQLVEASRARAAVVRRTGRGGAGNFNDAKGKRKLDLPDIKTGDTKLTSALVRKSPKVKETRRQTERNEGARREGLVPPHGHRRTGSTSSLPGSISTRRTKSTIHTQRKGLGRLWLHVKGVRNKRSLAKSADAIEFEVVELKPDHEQGGEAASPISPASDAVSFSSQSSEPSGVHRAIALARLERRTQRARLEEVPEEESWVDEGQLEKPSECIVSRSSDYSTYGGESKCAPSPKNTSWHTKQSVFREASAPRDSVGTFGRTRKSVQCEVCEGESSSDHDSAESIVDPHMHDA